ncbi:MAG: GTPase [Methanomassiliicoccales archaeon]
MLNFRSRIPTIMTSEELLDKAFKKVAKIDSQADSKLEMIRRKSVSRISSANDVLTTALQRYHNAFPSVKERQESFLVELMCTVTDMDRLKQALSKVGWAIGKLEDLRRNYTRAVKQAPDLNRIDDARKEYYGRTSSVIKRLDSDLKAMAAAREAYRKIPMVDEEMPTIVIAGFPNVGKSQLVERISTARPEVAPYPFTTKGIEVGRFDAGWRKVQVIDTPGLLDRPLEDRNAIELQAVLALKYLADVIIYVLDPSETSGYTMEKQLHLLDEIKGGFGDIPLILVENKADLIQSDSGRLRMSALTGAGVEDLVKEAMRIMKKEENALPREPLAKAQEED